MALRLDFAGNLDSLVLAAKRINSDGALLYA